MVDFLKRLFEKPDAAADSREDRDHALRLATAALFFEVNEVSVQAFGVE
jgi:hypothetical protein